MSAVHNHEAERRNVRRLLPRRSTRSSSNCTDLESERSASEEGSNVQATAAATGQRRRRAVRAACESCRKQKCKCDGKRPSCSRCHRIGRQCTYITDSGETHFSAMRRKCSSQEGELDSLKKLLHHIRTSSPEEVGKIVGYIRLYEDPVAAFNSYYTSTAAMYPTTEAGDETNGTSECQIDYQCGSESGACPTRGVRVRAEALPSTTIASSETISDLISQYFIFERPLSLPSVDCQTFIDGINKGDTTSRSYCSDLLMNAICAQQCFLSHEYSLGSVTRRYLGRSFLDECYRLLRQRDGHVTLPTAQAMTLIYQAELAEHLFGLPLDM